MARNRRRVMCVYTAAVRGRRTSSAAACPGRCHAVINFPASQRAGTLGGGMVSDDLWFSQNHRDLSVQYGDDAGFDFEFYCERCGDTWRSGYEKYGLGRATGWLRRAGDMAGGGASNIGWAGATSPPGVSPLRLRKAPHAAVPRAVTQARRPLPRPPRRPPPPRDTAWD